MNKIRKLIYRVVNRLILELESLLRKIQSKVVDSLPPPEQDDLTRNLLETLPGVAGAHVWHTEAYPRLFRVLEERGVHVTPNHFYSPIPDTRLLNASNIWEKESEMPGIDLNIDTQLTLLREAFPVFQDEYNQFPHQKIEGMKPYEFYFNNGVFDGIDALILYSMVRYYRPERMIEVGSGWSTRVSALAALKNGNTRLNSIEPYPNEMLKSGFPGLSMFFQKKIEDVELDFFQQLEENDILFIDTSHVVKTGGDVNYLYLEVLPRLKKGVIIHIHDIFFPCEYPKWWVVNRLLFWNEQYLLQAFLAFNSHFRILFANKYMDLKYFEDIQRVFPKAPFYHTGQSLWMQKIL